MSDYRLKGFLKWHYRRNIRPSLPDRGTVIGLLLLCLWLVAVAVEAVIFDTHWIQIIVSIPIMLFIFLVIGGATIDTIRGYWNNYKHYVDKTYECPTCQGDGGDVFNGEIEECLTCFGHGVLPLNGQPHS